MTMRVGFVCVVFGIVSATCAPAGAEPRFLSKQYNRCSSCHYSESGGGLLTPYGRALSGQELATTRRMNGEPAPEGQVSGEEAFLFGALGDRLGPVQLGISLRPSHLHFESGGFSESRNLLMNADVEGAYRGHGWTAYGEAGRMPAIGSENARLYSREHWISYESKRSLGIKVGRYMPAYGIHFADHTSFNRSDLGFDKYDQVYGIEVSRASDKSLLQVSVSPGRAESIVNDDGGRSLNATGVVVGSALYRDGSTLEPRHGAGGGAIGFAPGRRLTIWTEGDAHIRDGGGGTSFVVVNETAVEAFRGVWFKVSPQGRTGTDLFPGMFRWNLGASLLPRAHVNLSLDFYFDKIEQRDQAFKTFLAQLHMYL
jgi:hypothetical protein